MVVNTVKRLEGTYYVANIYIESQQPRWGSWERWISLNFCKVDYLFKEERFTDLYKLRLAMVVWFKAQINFRHCPSYFKIITFVWKVVKSDKK